MYSFMLIDLLFAGVCELLCVNTHTLHNDPQIYLYMIMLNQKHTDFVLLIYLPLHHLDALQSRTVVHLVLFPLCMHAGLHRGAVFMLDE